MYNIPRPNVLNLSFVIRLLQGDLPTSINTGLTNLTVLRVFLWLRQPPPSLRDCLLTHIAVLHTLPLQLTVSTSINTTPEINPEI